MNVKEARKQCGYQDKPTLPVCMNCVNFTSDVVLPAWMDERNKSGEGVYFSSVDERYTIDKHGVEKNLRCKAGGFSVKKMASCKLFEKLQDGSA